MTKALTYPDFYANEFKPAHRSNYTLGRQGAQIDKIVVHVTQGSYSSAYNWAQNPEANVSFHYLLAQSGWACQHVFEANACWHAGNWNFNKTSVALEHSGFISDRSMWTEAMYRNSAKIAAGIIHRAPGIPNDRFGYHLWAHSSIPGSTHTDPGRYFDWDKYIELIAGFLRDPEADNPPVQSAPSDTVYKVLVGAFSQRSYADATADQLKAKGFGSYVYQSGSYHRVQAAALSDPVAADELVIKLKAAGWKDAYALAEKA